MKSFPLIASLTVSLAAAAAACSTALAAEPLFRPGLWETSNKAGGANGAQVSALLAAAQQQMNGMDPAQRARIEGMMARNGVVLENGGVSAKACITPEMAARQQMPVGQKGGCNYRFSPVAGNSISYTFSCSNPVARGEGTAVFNSPTSYTASTRVSGGSDGANSMTIESSGRWVGKDCGSIAPTDVNVD